MELKKIPLFSMASERLAWLSQRQKVLSHNLANADTPRFTPSDLKPLDFKQVLEGKKVTGTQIAATNPAHFAQGKTTTSNGAFSARKDRHTYETNITGNQVSIEEQMMKMADTAMNYEATTNIYKKHLSMIKEALGRNSR